MWDDRGVNSALYGTGKSDTVVIITGDNSDLFNYGFNALYGIASAVDLGQSTRVVALVFQPTNKDSFFIDPWTGVRIIRELYRHDLARSRAHIRPEPRAGLRR